MVIQFSLDGVDGQPGKRMVGGIELHLTHGLQATGLVLNLHVVEGRVNKINATKQTILDGCYIFYHRNIHAHADRPPFLSD